ncbi:MAG: class I SAM-dependent DNA methyltransferase, partial [Chromatiaceae bacterium]|nr:class I SAM-dependent DNA methyltransferase [Chromatiaceae bacterium]
VSAFQVRLANIRVLDPACGSGNFLYVTLEHLKRLEGEVLDILESLGQRQTLLALEGVSVDPHQLLGLELNPRAAAIAETVLWIGYLQWHFRTHGSVNPPEPIIRDFRNIQCRDAVLAYERMEWVTDKAGRAVTRWDGRTTKTHPVTGEAVPDEGARVPLERYVNPRRAEWPEADFVVGNPPFIGNKRMRLALGDGYVEALRGAWGDMPGSADYVMYWWHRAAELVRTGRILRFGFITTNSLKQSFNRQIIDGHCGAGEPLSLIFAVPDHPWVDSTDGAAVRIAMTVGQAGVAPGVLLRVVAEQSDGNADGVAVEFERGEGKINPDLTIGANLSAVTPLRANLGLAFTGMYPLGQGFVIQPDDLPQAVGTDTETERVLKPFVIARDLTQIDRHAQIIDFYPRTMEQARTEFPCLFQWVLERVKPERDQNPRPARRDNWWRFAEPNPSLRKALQGLDRMQTVPRTAKWFSFQFVSTNTIPDTAVVALASADPFMLGVLSSRVHLLWATAAGGRLGVGNDTRYQHKQTFNPFPFPAPEASEKDRIRQLAEDLDAHRKQRQALHPGLTMTGMYNVLEQLRRGEPLSPKERTIHEQGLVSVLRQLHDELDAAILSAYGWSDLTPTLLAAAPGSEPAAETAEAILQRLVTLNTERAAEERRGLIRWLRPEFQHPAGTANIQAEAKMTATTPTASGPKPNWPKSLPEQFQALRAVLALHPGPATASDLAQGFTRAPRAKLAELLETLATLGHARRLEDGRYLPG